MSALRRRCAPVLVLAAVLATSACGTRKAPSDPVFAEARGRVLTPADEAIDDDVVAYLPGERGVLYAATSTTGGGPPALVTVELATGRRRVVHTGLYGYSSVYVLADGSVLFAAASVADSLEPTRPSDTRPARWGYYRLPPGVRAGVPPGGPAEALVAPGTLGTEGTPLLGTDAVAVMLSPDSTRLGYVSAGRLGVYDLAARTARPLVPVVPDALVNMRFTPDGAALLAPLPGDPYASLRAVSVEDGQPGAMLTSEQTYVAPLPERAEWETDAWGLRNPFSDTYDSYDNTLYLLGAAGQGRRVLARARTRAGGTTTGGASRSTGLSSVIVAGDGRSAVYLIEGRLYTSRLP